MNYQANERVMVYTWIGDGLKRKVPAGEGKISGRVRYIDNSIFYEVDLLDGLSLEFVHESNVQPLDLALEYREAMDEWAEYEMGWE